MMTKTNTIAFSALLFFAASCNQGGAGNGSKADSVAAKPLPISISDVPASPEFPDAQLSIASVNATPVGKDSAKVSFAYTVKNYELKNQTADAGTKLCNNSDKGQHIHFIMDNKPYVALYEPKNEVTLPINTEHYLMCFLSRSYHESIKSKGAAAIYHFKIDSAGKLVKMDDPTTPMVFYSRPKGDYLGKDTANVLLDFYVWNAALGNDFKVKAEVRNEGSNADTSFMIDSWKPHFIHGIGTGHAMVTLTLVGKDGQPVSGPNTTMSRNIRLAASEPIQ